MQFKIPKIEQKKKYREVYNGFLGVDYATSPFDVDKKRAIDMRNFINKDGLNHKRNGWEEIFNFGAGGKINGYWEVNIDGGLVRLVQLGKAFYRITSFDNISAIPITLDEGIDTNDIIDDRSYGVVAGERLYIFCGDYLVFYKDGSTYKIKRVAEATDTYIPITTIGIAKTGSSLVNTRTGYDKVNLLTSKRINKLIGEDTKSKIINYTKINNNPNSYGVTSYIYKISLKREDLSNFYLTIKNVLDGYEMENDFDLSSSGSYVYDESTTPITDTFLSSFIGWTNGETGKGLDTFFEALLFEYEYTDDTLEVSITAYYKAGKELTDFEFAVDTPLEYVLDSSIDEGLVKVTFENDTTVLQNVYDSGTETWGTSLKDGGGVEKAVIGFASGSITFNTPYPSIIEGESNIIVEFSKTTSGNTDKITKCRFGTLYGANGERDNLFVSGNPAYPNVDFHSRETYLVNPTFDKQVKSYSDFTYFPDTDYRVLGSDLTAIIDYKLLSDGTQMIMKEYSADEPSIYFGTTSLIDALDDYGNQIKSISGYVYKDIAYPTHPGTIGKASINRLGNANLEGDIIVLGEKGVFGIELAENVTAQERYAYSRSRLIEPELKQLDLTKAVGFVYDGKYYLATNDSEYKCYVADSRYKFRLKGDENKTFNYEWWVLDNIPAYIFMVINNKLCFGTTDGKICEFKEDVYQDMYRRYLPNGALTYNMANNIFTIASEYESYITEIASKNLIKMFLLSTDLAVTKLSFEDMTVDEDGETIHVSYEDFLEIVRYIENKQIRLECKNWVELDDLTVELDEPGVYYGKQNETWGVLLDEVTIYHVASSHLYYTFSNSTGEFTSTTIPINTFDEIYSVSDLDYENYTFKLRDSDDLVITLPIAEFDISMVLDDEELYVEEFDSDLGTFKVADIDGNVYEAIHVYYERISPIATICYFELYQNIVAYWNTPITSLGSYEYAKNMSLISVVPETIYGGEIVFGYQTRDSNEEFDILGIRLFSFEDIDFTNFTFETSQFAKSYTKTVKEKNFNFIIFIFGNESNKDCCINSFTINYNYGRINKGVK